MNIIETAKGLVSKSRAEARGGTYQKDTSTLWSTPWMCRDEDGLYGGWNKDAWLYWEMPVDPLLWEDAGTRLDRQQLLEGLLSDLGDLESSQKINVAMLSNPREIHVVSLTWEEPGEHSASASGDLADFQDACLDFLIPRKAVVVGVKLRPDNAILNARYKGMKGFVEQAKEVGSRALGESGFDREVFATDRAKVERIFHRADARPPSPSTLAQLESWYNLGRGPDCLIQVADDVLYMDDFDRIEISAVQSFGDKMMSSPDSQWILDAATNPNGPRVVSVRAQLQTSAVARTRARRAQRRIRAQVEEEMATGDIERVEDTMAYEQSQETERMIAVNQEILLAECSIVMARRVASDTEESYIDDLKQTYGIEMRPLILRQLEALDEMLPCSQKRVNPFPQDIFAAVLAYSGILGWSNLGDSEGLLMGLADPDYTPVWLDVAAAPAENKPPAMGIFGDPGSGKTYLCQMIATQATLEGRSVIFINPKGFSTLSPFAELVGGQVVKMSELEEDRSGYFDPFRFCEPDMAAEVATNFILQVLGNTGVAGMGFTASQELKLGSGLKRGARAGARCVIEAMAYVDDIEVRNMVEEQLESSSLFALGVARTSGAQLQGAKGLTLIEFDRKLDFPPADKSSSEYTRSERLALAAVRLVTRASMEILVGSGGGVMIVDEAWTFLSSSEGLASLQQIGREGRSLNLLPIFATQRVNDLIKDGVDMESYMSRVMVMKLSDPKEAAAAFRLCGLEPTEPRTRWLAGANPRPPSDGRPARPAMGILRDLSGRHAPVFVGPVPPVAHTAFTTNPKERQDLEASRSAAAHQPVFEPLGGVGPQGNANATSSPADAEPQQDETTLDGLFR